MLRHFLVFILLAPLATGQSLKLAVSKALDGRSGTAIILSVADNRVVASYRPDVAAKRVVLPGSAIKPFVLLELLRSGRVAPETEWSCRRHVRVETHNLDCQHIRTVEAMNAERALAYSCNSYFTEMGARANDEQMRSALRRAGFGSTTHLVASEASGSLQSARTRESLQLMSVGEDGIRVTPLQLAASYRKLAVQAQSSDEALKVVLSGLHGAVAYGTAQGAQVPGTDVAGKTGTSTAEEGPWTHGWFAGFAPASNPEVVVVVFLERGHGSEAATIAGTILKAYARGSR